MKRRTLSLFLSMCLVLGLLPAAAFAQDTIQYVALGDSITTGYRLGEGEQSFAEIIAAENGYELINLAKDGATSADLLDVIQNEANAATLENADLITITIGGNDLMGALYEYLADKYNEGKDESEQIDADDVRDALADQNDPIRSGVISAATTSISTFADSEQAKRAGISRGQPCDGR